MIIDSHAHYAYPKFQTEFLYLCEEGGNWTIRRGTCDELLAEMQKSGISGFIEPSIGFDAIERQMALVTANQTCMWAALGVHPTRCIHTPRKNRVGLRACVEQARADGAPIVAIGETGLDYHYPRGQQHRLRQKQWFAYQIKLADHLKLPLVLHIRDADGDALRILRRYRSRLHGGVVHCFGGDLPTAEAYIGLGYALGIGGRLLWDDEEGRRLSETVRRVPLSALVVETDAPFVFPDIGDGIGGKNQRKKLCNTSLILPAVIRRIAALRDEPAETVEETVYQNTVRIFGLHKKEINQ